MSFIPHTPEDVSAMLVAIGVDGIDNLFDKQFRRHLSSLDAEGRTFKLTLARTF